MLWKLQWFAGRKVARVGLDAAKNATSGISSAPKGFFFVLKLHYYMYCRSGSSLSSPSIVFSYL